VIILIGIGIVIHMENVMKIVILMSMIKGLELNIKLYMVNLLYIKIE